MDLIGTVFPGFKARWLSKRAALASAERLYQSATTSGFHPRRGDGRSGNSVMEHARGTVTNFARYIEENSDLGGGVLDDLTDRVIGTGIVVEPQIKGRNGELIVELNDAVARAWKDWARKPEISGVIPWGELQRLAFRTLMRDGEAIVKHLRGVAGIDYPHPVPYLVDVLEPDYLPFDLTSDIPGGPSGIPGTVIHGIERNPWGQITAYHLLKNHPGEYLLPMSVPTLWHETDRMPIDQITHLRFSRRLGQLRGISIFHACMHRLQDLADYEESERLAAKISAAFAAAITKSPDMPGALTRNSTTSGERNFELETSMVFDDLLPGEKIETIQSNRPSNALEPYRAAMLKAVSAGTGARYSTIARTWDSSYTAMRQETVAHKPSTYRLQDYFVERFVRLVYEPWIRLAELSGTLDFARADPLTVLDAQYRGPGEPWIDPLDEVRADVLAINNGLKSRAETIRHRGGDPRVVDDEIAADGFVASASQAEDQGTNDEPSSEAAAESADA